MNYHIANEHSTTTAGAVRKCKMCARDFHSFCLLREHRIIDNGAQRASEGQKTEVTQLVGDVDDKGRKKELKTSNVLVDIEMENGTQSF